MNQVSDKQLKILKKYKDESEKIIKQMYEVVSTSRKKVEQEKYRRIINKPDYNKGQDDIQH